MHTVRLPCGVLLDGEDIERVRGLDIRVWNGAAVYLKDGRKPGRRLHHLIANASADDLVIHLNDDLLDCRKTNLRVATRGQRSQYVGKQERNAAGFKGVYFDKRRGRYIAQVCADGRKHYLGSFLTAEEAAGEYASKAANLHGEFFRLD